MAWENLKAFEDLKENADRSLDDREKADLNKISPKDIQHQKNKIGEKRFNIDWSSMTLKNIVQNLKFDAKGQKVTLNWKPIGWQSELWAAIQVYAIAHNKTIWSTWIDGKVWVNTIRWLQSTQNDMKAEKRESVPQSWEKIWMNELWNHVFTKEFNALWKTRLFKEMKLLTSDGYLNFQRYGWRLINERGEWRITYQSKIDGKTKTIDLRITKDRNDMIDCAVLAKNIADKVTAAEKALDTSTKNIWVNEGIESFRELKITNPVIRKWASEKNINFRCHAYNNGRIKVYDANGTNLGVNGGWFMLNNTDLLTNGSFDETKFNNILKNKCYSMAVNGVKNYINRASNWINNTKITRSAEAEWVIRRYGNLIKEIDWFNDKSSFSKEKQQVVDAKNLAETKNFCYKELDKMNRDIRTLNNMSKVLEHKNKQKIIDTMKKYTLLTQRWQGQFNYVFLMQITKDVYNKFTKAWLMDKYQENLRTLKRIANNYEIEINFK